MIYFDNAATTLKKPKAVIDAVVMAMDNFGNCARGTHTGALNAARTVYSTRAKLGKMFGAKAQRVVFTANATEALNTAIMGAINKNAHIISTDLEHNSVLRPLYRLEKEQGAELSFVAADSLGNIDCADFERLIKANTAAIVCTHASNLVGNVLNVEKIGAVAHKHSLLFIVDASQSAGTMPIDMAKMNIDILCFTGHKGLMGPQGTGGLCLGENIDIRPLKVGGSGIESFNQEHPKEYPTHLEAGTLNAHGIAGLGAAVDFINKVGIDKIHQHENALMIRFYNGIKDIPNIKVYGDFSKERAPIVALNIGEYDSAAVADELSQTYGIATRPGAHCAPRLHSALKTKEQGAVRFSFGYFNTFDEVDKAVFAVRELSK